jgi:hypothetical protein
MPVVDPLACTLLLCEKVLNEADGVISTVRLIEMFFVPETSTPPDQSVVLMQVFINCKFPPGDDSKHAISLRLTRPDGSEKDVDFGMPMEVSLAEIPVKIPLAPKAFNFILPWGVKATHMGVHRVTLFVDGKENVSAIFTLVRPVPVDTK